MSFKLSENLILTSTEVIEEWDGPILSTYTSNTNEVYIGHLATTIELGDLIIFNKSSDEEIKQYKNKEISMRKLVKSDSDELCWAVAFYRLEVVSAIEIEIKKLPNAYQPAADAFYDEDYAPI